MAIVALISQAVQLGFRNGHTHIAVIVRDRLENPQSSNVVEALQMANQLLESPRMYLRRMDIPGGYRWRLTNGSTLELFSSDACRANFPGARVNAAYWYDDVDVAIRNAWKGHIYPREIPTKLGMDLRRYELDNFEDTKGRKGP